MSGLDSGVCYSKLPSRKRVGDMGDFTERIGVIMEDAPLRLSVAREGLEPPTPAFSVPRYAVF